MRLNTFLFHIAAFCFGIISANDFSEIVDISYLPNYNILAELQFKLSQKYSSALSTRDLGTFPELIYLLAEKFGLRDGRITFTRGIWDYQRWSKAPFNKASTGFQFNGQFSTLHGNLRYIKLKQLNLTFF